ncbi:MAG: endolytic transglycosylase MltG, partial [Sporomusaceae bacterium]|nr:endolytic transglycosylase MltG [Sporomusaceae bacterium]
LQSCATIQYILGYPKAELTVADTQIPSPYNTYQNMGLPPGPIANPGKAAIEAVLANQETEHLYFVADKTGRHHFSPSYAEHLEKIAQVESGQFDEK